MQLLLPTLKTYDLHLLTIIANRWDVDLSTPDPQLAATQLATAMLDPLRAEAEWVRLGDRERGALQMLLGAKGHKMALTQYSRLYGAIREMGEDARRRETPHLQPQNMSEVLYYRGLLAIDFDQGAAGLQKFIYVPSDLAAVLPTHLTGYDLSAEADDGLDLEHEQEAALEVKPWHGPDDTLIDDLTTLLAYLQLEKVNRAEGYLSEYDRQALEDYFLSPTPPMRLGLMVGLLTALQLAAENEDAHFKPIPVKARQWLNESRSQQAHLLAEAWLNSAAFNELDFVAGLELERGMGIWQNDPRLLHKVIKKFLAHAPADSWFGVGELIASIKAQEADFQRPGGDYTSWYIKDEETGQFLKGFESWERVDGAMLFVALTQSLYWLGLVELGQSEAGEMLRLTDDGRAFAEKQPWPSEKPADIPLQVSEDGRVIAPRSLSRYDRFQLARFTDWEAIKDGYEYQISANSLLRADKQGIKAEHISTFLKRTSHNQVPQAVYDLLEQWAQAGGASVVLSHADLLETESQSTLDTLWEIPQVRRFLGTRLGERAVIVRPGMWSALVAELHSRGMLVEEEQSS
jgi:hypothetical protein